MKFSFLPKEYKFFDLFDQMASYAGDAARCFKEFAVNGTFGDKASERMHVIERNCDEVTHDIIDKLNRTFVTPFDREDIYSLAHELDSVVDIIHAITKRMLLYNLDNDINQNLIKFADLIEQSVCCLAKAVKGLRNLKQPQRVLECCIEVNSIENLGDQLRDEVLGSLFDNATDPLFVMKWKDIFQDAETVLDQCEDVANIVESVLVKQA